MRLAKVDQVLKLFRPLFRLVLLETVAGAASGRGDGVSRETTFLWDWIFPLHLYLAGWWQIGGMQIAPTALERGSLNDATADGARNR